MFLDLLEDVYTSESYQCETFENLESETIRDISSKEIMDNTSLSSDEDYVQHEDEKIKYRKIS